MRQPSWNPVKLTAELSAADDAINPLLESAKISSIKVDGKDVPASKAPLNARISAYADVTKAGATSADAVELATLNGQVTAQLEKVEAELAIAKSSVSTLTQEKSVLASELSVAQSSVSKLTADNAELGSRNDTLAKQLESSAGKINAQHLALAKDCLEVGAIDFKNQSGKPLAKDASDDAIVAASKEHNFDSLRSAFKGAVNSALAKTGVSFDSVPFGAPAASSKKPGDGLTGLAKVEAIIAAQLAAAK